MIIFYDKQCPLCDTEMQHLVKSDKHQVIRLEDLNSADFSERFPAIDKAKAMNLLHAITDSGEMIYGLDVTYQAWKLVGKYPWLVVLRLPIIRYFADLAYNFFAKHRQTISKILIPNSTCEGNQCSPKK